jgi:hypothetical protein
MRVRLKLKNLDEINGVIEKKVRGTIKNKETTKQVAKIVSDGVKERKISVKSKVTLAWRRYLERGNKTDEKYSRTRINFTFTGDLLKDLINNAKLKINKKGAEYTIQNSKGIHKKYRKPDGKPLKGKAVSFKQINNYLNSLGYYYLQKVSKKNTKKIIKYLRKEIMRRFK